MRKVIRISCPMVMLLLGWSGPVAAPDTIIELLPDDRVPRAVRMENQDLRLRVEVGRSVYLTSFFDKAGRLEFADPGNPAPLVKLNHQWHLLKTGFHIWQVSRTDVEGQPAVKIELFSNYLENPYHLLITLSLWRGAGLHLDIRVENRADPAIHDIGYVSRQTLLSGLSFLRNLKPAGAGEPYVIFPNGRTFFHNETSGPGMYFLRQDDSPSFPIVAAYPELEAGLLLDKDSSDLDWSFQSSEEALSFLQPTPLGIGESFVIFRGALVPFRGDWQGAFRWWKNRIRSRLDLSNYRRAGHREYRRKILTSFTMAFDHNFYDPERNAYRLEEFLARGEREFGGFDSILFWHAYPRLGIDPRDEWEMYQGLPGGVEGLRQLVKEANRRGVWVFLSYNPWDVIGRRESLAEEQAKVLRATGANGTYLDILRGATADLREVFDRVDPGIVFSSENRPGFEGLEVSTGSQEDHRYITEMPRLDLLRFVLPEHSISNTERMGRNRSLQIRNALFNFVGLTVWEDVFGEINRYSWDERILIYRYNRLAHDYLETFLSEDAEPLIPARHLGRPAGRTPYESAWNPDPPTPDSPPPAEAPGYSGLYVNRFASPQQVLYSLYHDGHGAVDRFHDNRAIGKLFPVRIPESWHLVNVWDGLPMEVVEERGKPWAYTPVELPDESCVIAAMPGLIRVRRDGDGWRASVERAASGELRLTGFDLERRPIYGPTAAAGSDLLFRSEAVPCNVDGYVMLQFLKNGVVADALPIKVQD